MKNDPQTTLALILNRTIRFLLILTTIGIQPGFGEDEKPSSVDQTIVAVGASLTSGLSWDHIFEEVVPPEWCYTEYLDYVLSPDHKSVTTLGSRQFFSDPFGTGKQIVDQALALKPSLVLALDFPFWFLYGEYADEEAAKKGFETGLEMLERFDCPIIVGDIPDALDSQIINKNYIPTPQRLKYGNERIREWADANEKITLVSIATLMENCKTNAALSLGTLNVVAEGKSFELLQEDGLHLTPRGCSVLGLIVADLICQSFPETDSDGLKTRISEFGKNFDQFYTESGTKIRKVAD